MKNFVMVRAQKCAAWGDGNKAAKVLGVGGQTKHDLRLIDTPNADPERREENLICSSETDWKLVRLTRSLAARIGANRADFFSAKARDRMARLGIPEPQRPDVVRTINFIATVSPEWLRNGDESGPLDAEKSGKFSEAAAEFFRMKYGENFLGCVLHLDELNPHCSAYVLPAVHMVRRAAGRPRKDNADRPAPVPAATWGLRAKSLLTPDQRMKSADRSERIYDSGSCSKLQTEFAAFCQAKGMDVVRGVHGSRATHKTLSEHNHLLRSAVVLEKEIAGIDDAEKLRAIALQNALKAREHGDLQAKLRASVESERKTREDEYRSQQKLLAAQHEKRKLEADLFKILTTKRVDLLDTLLEELRKKFRISAKIASAMAAKGLLYANALGNLVVTRWHRKQITGHAAQDLATLETRLFGDFGVTPFLSVEGANRRVIATEPLEALAIATHYAGQPAQDTVVFMAAPLTDETRVQLLRMERSMRLCFARPGDPARAEQLERQAKETKGMQIIRPPDGFGSWLEALRAKEPPEIL